MIKFTLSIFCFLALGISVSNAQFSKIYDFPAENDLVNSAYSQPAYDGIWLYDVSANGGTYGLGCIYKIKSDGTNYTKLLDFSGMPNGSEPLGSLTLSDSFLYGMTVGGGMNGTGVIFKINTDGTGYIKLLDFTGTPSGRTPYGSLTLSGSFLYGMTHWGGLNNLGTIFKIGIDGTGYTKLLDFEGITNGKNPYSFLTVSGSALYGTTNSGGANDKGTLFKINTDGSGYTKLLDFAGTTNGSTPIGALTISGTDIYGMTYGGGANNNGTIYRINTDGTGYTNLQNFTVISNGTAPIGTLVLSGSVLYGMTSAGGAKNDGVIFKINSDGTGYNKLLDFTGTINGNCPWGSLTLSGSVLFGTTFRGGISDRGVLFKINTDGSAFSKILDYNKALNGCYPLGSLTLSGSEMYGVSYLGGTNGIGTIYKISTDGSGYSKLFDFDGINTGSNPCGSLIFSGSVLYGTTSAGGTNGKGTIFKINSDGSGYTKLLDFDGITNGSTPLSHLILSGSVLYGMTYSGGVNNYGTLFKINTDGTGFAKLIDFSGATNGSFPAGSLTISGSTIYGMTDSGGVNGLGTIFRINSDGTGYTKLLDFAGTTNGSNPSGSLTILGSVLYGMNSEGGSNGKGTIFKINTDGTGYTKLQDFDYAKGYYVNSSIVLSGSVLYGTAEVGGSNGKGTFFKVNTDGTGFGVLKDFNGVDGETPSDLVLGINTLYGITREGGIVHAGVIFKYEITPCTSPTAPSVGAITQPTCSLATGALALSGLPASGSWTLTQTPGGTTTTGTGTTSTITGLATGTYTYSVTNASGCTSPASTNVVINTQPQTPTAPTVGTITQPTCAVATGGVFLTGLPSSATWTLTRTPGGTTTTGTGTTSSITGLAAGTYTYTVTNASGCTSPASTNVVINAQPQTPTAPTVGTITQPTCAIATGSVILNGLPATGTWTLTRTPGGTTSTGTGTASTIAGLAAGTYTYTVTNASGCTSPASASVVINAQPQTPTAPAVGTIAQPTCAVATGSVTLNGLPATGAWTLTRTPGGITTTGTGASTTITGLVSGTYTYTVTNASGCTSSSSTNVLINAQPQTATAATVGTITQPTCAVATGSVTLNGLPATGIWTLTRTPGGTTTTGTGTMSTITGLASGTYTYTVTNASGCTSPASASVVINPQPQTPIAPAVGTIIQPTCAIATGSVVLNGLPTTGTWTLTRTPGGTTSTGSGTASTIIGLASGTYTYTVTNTSGCTSSSSTNVLINAQPQTATAPTVGTITQPTCAIATGSVVLNDLPASGTWILTRTPGGVATTGTGTSTTVSGLEVGTYTYSVANVSGCVSVSSANVVIIANPSTPMVPTLGTITQPTITVLTGSVVLNGLPSSGAWTLTRTPGGVITTGVGASTIITGLAPGTYTFTVTNALGCTSGASASVAISAQSITPSAPVVGIITQPTCTVTTGSVALGGLPAAGTWTITRIPGGATATGAGTSTTIAGLAAGSYSFTVTNLSGNTSTASASVLINAQPIGPPAPIVGTITQPNIAEATGSVVLRGLPANGAWILTRTPGGVTTTGSGSNIALVGLTTGTYTYTVTNSSGCTSSASANVVINSQPTSGIDDGNSQVANSLGQNYPNPFDRSTTIEFSIVKPSQVTLSVFNTLGKEVDVIVNEFLSNGSYTRNWEPKNLPNGIYYYHLGIEGFKATRRLIIVK